MSHPDDPPVSTRFDSDTFGRQPETDLRLIAPRLTDAELVFMLELHRLEREGVEAAIADLNHALLHNDVEAGIRAARRFHSLGTLMYAAQTKVVGL